MYNRTITIDTSRPADTLAELKTGQNSAMLLVVKGVPPEASAVSFIRSGPLDEAGVSFDGDKLADGTWRVRIRSGFFDAEGMFYYTINVMVGDETYWSGTGLIRVKATPNDVSVGVVVTYGKSVV